jgi:hypothetical protein
MNLISTATTNFDRLPPRLPRQGLGSKIGAPTGWSINIISLEIVVFVIVSTVLQGRVYAPASLQGNMQHSPESQMNRNLDVAPEKP